jgi:hypothetical protein
MAPSSTDLVSSVDSHTLPDGLERGISLWFIFLYLQPPDISEKTLPTVAFTGPEDNVDGSAQHNSGMALPRRWSHYAFTPRHFKAKLVRAA